MRRLLIGGLLAASTVVLIPTTVNAVELDLELGTKVTLCHAPPGNPENAHVINVSIHAVAAHLGNHDGDFLVLTQADVALCLGIDLPPIVVTGPAGPKGNDGLNAYCLNGIITSEVESGSSDSENESESVASNDSRLESSLCLRGEKGDPGVAGRDGVNGRDGASVAGPAGVAGLTGPAGTSTTLATSPAAVVPTPVTELPRTGTGVLLLGGLGLLLTSLGVALRRTAR